MHWKAGRNLERSEWIQESIRLLGRLSVLKFKFAAEILTENLKTFVKPAQNDHVKERLMKYYDESIFKQISNYLACMEAIVFIVSEAAKDLIDVTYRSFD